MLNRKEIVSLLGEDLVREMEWVEADEVDRDGEFILAESHYELYDFREEDNVSLSVKMIFRDIYCDSEEGWQQPGHCNEFELYGYSKRDTAYINMITRGFI